MAFIHEEELPWHEGEKAVHRLLRVPEHENPTSTFLTPGAGHLLSVAPLLALGALDNDNNPWTTLWGGEPGFARPIGKSIIGVKTLIDRQHDPVAEALFGVGTHDGEVISEGNTEGAGKMVGGLTIHLEKRLRVKLYGKMVAGAVSKLGEGKENDKAEVQLVVRIEQSVGNCPKYLNKKRIHPMLPDPKSVSYSLPLSQAALDLVSKADLFFISSSHHLTDMDTNHRGGPPGFVRFISNSIEAGTVLIYPEYSGNRLYQTIGNLQTTPRAGIVIPDFENGNVLYVTGMTEILAGRDADKFLPGSNLAITLTVTAARFVENGLPFRGTSGERSPYNPRVRYLPTEPSLASGLEKITNVKALLVKKENLTPTISRFRFRVVDPEKTGIKWHAGQHVALSFVDELHRGYSHMRDDDPLSLNDDFVRTFTVSSPPFGTSLGVDSPAENEFEITIRKVGAVTDLLFRQMVRSHLEIPLNGFGGQFVIDQKEGEHVGFVAGGVGITPLLAQLPGLDLSHFRLIWTVRRDDLNLVGDVFNKYPNLPPATSLFVTGTAEAGHHKREDLLTKLSTTGLTLTNRRMIETDIGQNLIQHPTIHKWYICAGTALRKDLLKWLEDKDVVYEDFGY